ncbi:MAG: glycosyltransferase [Muribaculaceae bacterium]|nr:glycosyltransferase [Muribaculaceae bacterium]
MSIIVPVYNCKDYLARTVEALATQDLPLYEIILVDDGSTDGSAELCDKLAQEQPVVKCHHLTNGGPGRARNYGIEHAAGKYISFCDADDIPASNMYGKMLDVLKQQSVDLVLCDIYTERDGRAFGFPWSGNVHFEGEDASKELFAAMLGNLSDNDTTQPVWGSSVRCIYRKDILIGRHIRFPEDIRFAEDLVFNVRYIKWIKSCYILNEVLYRYTFNPDSLMNGHVKYNPTNFRQRLSLVSYITEIIKDTEWAAELLERFRTTQRSYFIESVGNAARAIGDKGYGHAYNEIKKIVHHPVVMKAFASYDAGSAKKWLSYFMVHRKLTALLLLYYRIRLGKQ